MISLFALHALSSFGQLVLSDNCSVTGGDSSGTGFGVDAGVNYQIASRLSGFAANGLSYLQTATGKAASSYSITSNKIAVAVAANPGRFTFTADRSTPNDFSMVLGTDSATPTGPAVYEVGVKISNRSSGTERTSFGVSTVDSGVQDWNLGVQLVNSGVDLNLYRRVDAASNPTGADYNDVIATLPGQAGAEISLRIRITDAGAETGTAYSSKYEIFANGALVFSSDAGDFRFANSAARVVLFDTAPSAGPVTYDDFSMTVVGVANAPPDTNSVLKIESSRIISNGLEFVWDSHIGTNYTVLKATNLNSAAWVLVTNITARATNTVVDVSEQARAQAEYFRVAHLSESGLSATNISVASSAGGVVDIFYDLTDLYAGLASISVLVSVDGGLTYGAPAATFSGDVGAGITTGTNLHIVWNVGEDAPFLNASNVMIKIVADRTPLSSDMALIPAGAFQMGDGASEGMANELPVHGVNVSAFYMERHEVTKALWDDVVQWATNHGYYFDSPGVASQPNDPVQQVSWFDSVKWCNARSEKEGIAPAYFTDSNWTNVYRAGQVNLSEACVCWRGAGYCLATEAEWEKAARGGLDGKRFPFGDTITQAQANYWSTDFEAYDVNGTPGPHPLAPDFPNVLAVGQFLPTGYGLYDMAGNVWEWCWDYYGDSWYSDARSTQDDTHGPGSASWGGDRVYRGGSGVDIAWKSRVANRADAPPRFAMGHFGFRVVLPAGENMVSAESPAFPITP